MTTAQKASCLEPKIFKRTLETVKNALAAKHAPSLNRNNTNMLSWKDGRSREQRALRDSFLPILEKHRLGRPKLVATWMQWAYSSMREHLRAEMIEASDQDLKIAAYQYVAAILKVSTMFFARICIEQCCAETCQARTSLRRIQSLVPQTCRSNCDG